MKKFLGAVALSAVSVAVAMPAQANEARAEVRGGVFFGGGAEEASVGAAAGYDWSLSDTLFVGLEASADKILDGAFDDVSFGVSGRLGTSFGPAKVYAIGGYQTEPCDLCVNAWSGGAGAQFGVSENAYLKAEYRHFFTSNNAPDFDAVLIGIGIAMD